jgi:glycosyltransferase involved in cell wall biosynthesis
MSARKDRPLRILYHHRIAAADGMRVHMMELIGALRKNGHDVLVVGPASSGDHAGARSRLEGVADRLRKVLPASLYELLELLYNVPAYVRLHRAARAFKPDILYERYNLFLLAGLLLRKRRNLPMLLEVNSPLAHERAEFGGLALKGVARRCEAALWRGADAVLPVTDVLAQLVRQTRGGASDVHVIPNGVDLEGRPSPADGSDIRRQLQLSSALVLGFVGFVRAWHGLDWAVEALPNLPPHTRLLIVGDGPAADDLRRRAEALGVADRLRIVGRVSHDKVAAYMQSFDIALQPAAVPYASPLKLFEYMGLGRAIIAPDQPNIREVLTSGENALLFAPGDRAAFRAALQRLCLDAALRAQLGANAFRTARDTPYSWAHNARRIEVLGRGLIQARSRSETR